MLTKDRGARRRTRCAVAAVACLAVGGAVLRAQPVSPGAGSPGDEQELGGLMALLAEETEIATRTKMNADFVPGTVSVLRGEELEALGVETVWDALALVPGMQAVRDVDATPTLVVRGTAAPFNQGNVKILVDGTDLSRPVGGVNSSVLYLPIEQVERIEVIRGPGAVLYGDFALAGVVNIVTRAVGDTAWLRADSDRARAAGGRLSRSSLDGRAGLVLDVAGWTSDEAPFAEPDQADETRLDGHLTASFRDLRLSVQSIGRRVDPAGGGERIYDEATWGAELKWERELRPGLVTTVRLGHLDTDIEGAITLFDSTRDRLDASLSWEGAGRHHLVFGFDLADSHIDRALESPPVPPGGGGPPPRPIGVEDLDRSLRGVTLQDRIEVTEEFEVTAGVRYDDQELVGTRWTPRLAMVWRASEHHIFKAQYAEGFRPPTFFELAAGFGGGATNPNLDFEKSATRELSYIHRRPNATMRLTLFDTDGSGGLRLLTGPPPRFVNSGSNFSRGVELEWEQRLGSGFELAGNLSYVDADDPQDPAERGYAASKYLGNLTLLWRPVQSMRAGVRWSHVDDRPSEDPDGYDALDLTLSWEEIGHTRLGLRAGVDDLLDDGVRDPVRRGGFATTAAFPGRRLWLQLAWKR